MFTAARRSSSATRNVIVCRVLRPLTSVTVNVKAKSPASAGTPLIVAVEPLPWSPMKPTCVGSDPWVSSKRYGPLPPLALSSIESGTATSATWFTGAPISRAGTTSSENCLWDAAPPAETSTVKDIVPGVVGVPLSTPLEACDRPAGNEPAPRVQLFVPEPPDAASVSEYGLPTLAVGRHAVVIESDGAGAGSGPGPPPPTPLMVIVNSRCASEGRHQSAEGGF